MWRNGSGPLWRAPLAMSDFHLAGAFRASFWEMTSTMLNASAFPLGLNRQDTLDRLAFLAWFTDSAARIPGTSRTIGADGVLSLIPGIGSLLGTGMSLYMVAEAIRHGAPAGLLARMGANVAVDTVLSAIPIVGFLFDFIFKANQRNLALLREHLKESN